MAETKVGGKATLRNMLETGHAPDLRMLLLKMLEMVMEDEVTAMCGAEPGERTSERVNSRNGYRERDLETRVGTLGLSIPKLRQGSYLPSFVEPRRRWERAFVNVVCEAYVHGVSTRKVEDLIEAMGAKGVSKSTVSRMAEELDAHVAEFRGRPLTQSYPYVWLDAIYHKIRVGARVVSKAVLIAYAVGETGHREVLGVEVADGEMETAWRAFLEGLLARGLRGVQLVIADAHSGLRKAVRGVLNGCSVQRCTVHFLRNVLSHVPRAAQPFVSAAITNIFRQASLANAREAVTKALALLERYDSAAAILREAEDDVLAFMAFPETHWRQIHSTNPLERLNREIRRRTDVVGIFPNDNAALRLIGMLLIEQHEEWLASDRRYFSQESMGLLKAPAAGLLTEAA